MSIFKLLVPINLSTIGNPIPRCYLSLGGIDRMDSLIRIGICMKLSFVASMFDTYPSVSLTMSSNLSLVNSTLGFSGITFGYYG